MKPCSLKNLCVEKARELRMRAIAEICEIVKDELMNLFFCFGKLLTKGM
jgi:hypothetical protein